MSLMTEELKHSVNTLEEVRKLQELVKKLEIQNLHLRNKQNTQSKKSISPVKIYRKISDAECNDENPHSERDLDDLDIIKLSDIELSDDESWLYKSPKSSREDHENSYEWLRKDADDLENKPLQLAKNALLSKVTELGQEPRRHVDTRTFTRSKKKQTLEFLSRLDMVSNEKVQKNCWPRRGSSDSLSSSHVLEDASDVEEVARLQEESLRNSSPLGTPKRGSYECNILSRKISLSSRCSASDQDLSESSLLGIPNAEGCPGNELVAEPSHHSDQSSSSESPYSSNVSLHSNDKIHGKLSGYRRSLPNLNREPLAARQSKSSSTSDKGKLQNRKISARVVDSHLQSSQKPRRDCSSPLRRPLNQRSTPNAETTVSKSVESSHLRARSGLPRPSRASSASRSATRSGIPMPSMLSKKQEDSWSEGCF